MKISLGKKVNNTALLTIFPCEISCSCQQISPTAEDRPHLVYSIILCCVLIESAELYSEVLQSLTVNQSIMRETTGTLRML